MAEFQCWLYDRLTSLKVDADVFSTYMEGILEGDEKPDDKVEAIQGLLSSAFVDDDDIDGITKEIIAKFDKLSVNGNPTELPLSPVETCKNGAQNNTFDEKVRSIFSQQTARASKPSNEQLVHEENSKLKSSILGQYSEVEVIGGDDVAVVDRNKTSTDQIGTVSVGLKQKHKRPTPGTDPLLVKNTNAQQVVEAEKMQREKNKKESEAKKAKDKQNRENQRKRDIERKEKEKHRTQKAERRR